MSSLSLIFLSFAFYLSPHFTIFFLSFLSMHADSDFDSMTTNNLRDSANGTFVSLDDSSQLTSFDWENRSAREIGGVVSCRLILSGFLPSCSGFVVHKPFLVGHSFFNKKCFVILQQSATPVGSASSHLVFLRCQHAAGKDVPCTLRLGIRQPGSLDRTPRGRRTRGWSRHVTRGHIMETGGASSTTR